MGVPKIVALTQSCKQCPNYSYFSGGQSICSLANQIVLEPSEIAPFCPLADYPSEIIASLQKTMNYHRHGYRHTLKSLVMTHIAAKLNCAVDPTGRHIKIPLRESSEVVVFTIDLVTQLSFDVIAFMDTDDKRYILYVDGDKPILRRKVGEDQWEDLSIV